jgi:hypothetical protein
LLIEVDPAVGKQLGVLDKAGLRDVEQ